jgi:hypothetical protein
MRQNKKQREETSLIYFGSSGAKGVRLAISGCALIFKVTTQVNVLVVLREQTSTGTNAGSYD